MSMEIKSLEETSLVLYFVGGDVVGGEIVGEDVVRKEAVVG